MFSRDKNNDVVRQNFIASISSALKNYGLSNDIVFDFAAWAVSNIARQNRRLAKELISELTKSSNRFLVRMLIEKLPVELTEIPAWFLLAKLEKDCNNLVLKIGG